MYSRKDDSQQRQQKRERMKQMDRKRNRAGGLPGKGIFTLMLVSLFVLIVFVGGVLVGINFFHLEEGHRSMGIGIGGSIVGHSAVSPVLGQHGIHGNNNLPSINSAVTGCCSEKTLSCLACQSNESPLLFCTHNENIVGCADVISSTLFNGSGEHIGVPRQVDGSRLTVSAWIYAMPGADNQEQTLMTTRTSPCEKPGGGALDDNAGAFTLSVKAGVISLTWGLKDGSCYTLSTRANAITTNQWTQVGIVFDEDAEVDRTDPNRALTARLYVNGQLVRTAAHQARRVLLPHIQADNAAGSKEFFRIGQNWNGEFGFHGRIADVLIYSGTFTAAHTWSTESPILLLGPNTALRPFLKLYFPLSTTIKQENAEVVDLSNSANHGVFHLTKTSDVQTNGNNMDGYHGKLSRQVAQAEHARQAKLNQQAAEEQAAKERQQQLDAHTQPIVKPYTNNSLKPGGLRGNMNNKNNDNNNGGYDPQAPRIDISLRFTEQELISGRYSDNFDAQTLGQSDAEGREAAERVKSAMQHSYGNYEKLAFGHDETMPKSGKPRDPWGHHAVTMIDSLDTLWIMNMKDEFWRARDYVRDHLSFDINRLVSTFETNIRDLGGLLSAYEFSGDKAFLVKAKDLGDRMFPIFNTPSGLPKPQVNLHTGQLAQPRWLGKNVLIAEIGTLQLEFRSLAIHTGERKYADAVEKVYEVIDKQQTHEGLVPLNLNPNTGAFSGSTYTFGAMGDSYYEYLLKVWVQGGQTEPSRLLKYQEAMTGMIKLLGKKTKGKGLTFLADEVNNKILRKMDHLACFVPGMLALGAMLNPNNPFYERDMEFAKAMMYTCYQMYASTATGISPEYVTFNGQEMEVPPRATYYILRPEVTESLFLLHYVTKNPIYRLWGRNIFNAVDKYCKVPYGYGHHPDVRDVNKKPEDKQESFFLAETLKYHYLLQSPEQPIDLTERVFNTEAHPLRVFKAGWRERLNQGIAEDTW